MATGDRFRSFMSKDAVAFVAKSTAAVAIAASVAVGASYAYVQGAAPEPVFAEQVMSAEQAPEMVAALAGARSSGFDERSFEALRKLDAEFVEILAQVRAESDMPFTLMPVANGGLFVAPVPVRDGKADYSDMAGSGKIMREISARAQERGFDLDCGGAAGRLSCGTGNPRVPLHDAPVL